MSHAYVPVPAPLTTVTCPDDGDARNAASVNVALEALANAVGYNGARYDVVLAGGTFVVPATVTKVEVIARGGGGGGGGGGKGNATNANDTGVTGGAGGGSAPEVRTIVTVVPGETLTHVIGAGGAAGAGSAVGDGATASAGAASTVTGSTSGLLVTAPGGGGGGGSVREIPIGAAANSFGGSLGGMSPPPSVGADYPSIIPVTTASAGSVDEWSLFAFATVGRGPGSGNTRCRAPFAGMGDITVKWPTVAGAVSTNGTDGADDGSKRGGFGGCGGGPGVVAGGAGGAGGAAHSGLTGDDGAAGSAAASNSGAGGGGGGSGGTGMVGGAGANGAAGGSGFVIYRYFGAQAVIT